MRRIMRNGVPVVQPLRVVRDGGCQANIPTAEETYIHWGYFLLQHLSIRNMVIFIGLGFFGICYLITINTYVQSLIVYSHYVKKPMALQEVFKIGLGQAKNIQIITDDGLILRGWHLMPIGDELIHANGMDNEEKRIRYFDEQMSVSKRIIVYFHGNSETRGQPFRLQKIKQLSNHLQAHVIAFDYRGFADSDGFPSEHGTFEDAKAVVQYVDNIVRRYNPSAQGYLRPLMRAVEDSHSDSTDTDISITSSTSLAPPVTQAPAEVNSGLFRFLFGFGGWQRSVSHDSRDGGERRQMSKYELWQEEKRRLAHIDQPHLYMYGHSLGAAIATSYAIELSQFGPRALAGLILDSPFTTLPDAMRKHPLTAPFRLFPMVFNRM